MIYIGEVSGKKQVRIGKGSPNRHIIITGISGSGKSVRIADIESKIMDQGVTIVALDINGTHERTNSSTCNYISAQKDGLNIKFLDTSLVEKGRESMTNLVQYIIETLCPREMRGACQIAAVRKAVKFAIENREQFPNEMEAILCGLKMQEESAALGAYNHLCPILEGNIFRKSNKQIRVGMLNIISLQGLNLKTQKRVAEIIMSALWREVRIFGSKRNNKLVVEIDEFQNLDFQRGSTLAEMLTEGRKYGVDLIMSTQTLSIFPKKDLALIHQAAVKLFFQQGITDLNKVATMIEPAHKDKWSKQLSRLKVGQAIAVGALEIMDREISQPIVTYSDYGEKTAIKLV